MDGCGIVAEPEFVPAEEDELGDCEEVEAADQNCDVGPDERGREGIHDE